MGTFRNSRNGKGVWTCNERLETEDGSQYTADGDNLGVNRGDVYKAGGKARGQEMKSQCRSRKERLVSGREKERFRQTLRIVASDCQFCL